MGTIKGYRSALAQVLKLHGTDLTENEDIGGLIRALEIQRPMSHSELPKWDLSLVLRHLLGAPYEPILDASLKSLSLKTVFLLGLASAKRIGEIHALTSNVSHTENWGGVNIQFDPSFIAKTRVLSDPSTHQRFLHVPALAPSVGDDIPDRKLCPVRALRVYLARTQKGRPKGANLFVSWGPGTKRAVSKVMLSHWIRQVVKDAHAAASEEDARLSGRTTHELRAIATSVLFTKSQSLSAVMEAACWRNHSTFSSFYLRDLTNITADLCSLGPIVAAQRVVSLQTDK